MLTWLVSWTTSSARVYDVAQITCNDLVILNLSVFRHSHNGRRRVVLIRRNVKQHEERRGEDSALLVGRWGKPVRENDRKRTEGRMEGSKRPILGRERKTNRNTFEFLLLLGNSMCSAQYCSHIFTHVKIWLRRESTRTVPSYIV